MSKTNPKKENETTTKPTYNPNAYGGPGPPAPSPIRTQITRVNYTWKEKPYVYYMFGNELKVNADDYPFTCC